MVEFDQMWFIFQLVSPAVHTLLPSVLQRLDSYGREVLILTRKSPQPQIWPHHWIKYCFPARCFCFFHVGEQRIVRWCQFRRIWRVINHLNATVMQTAAIATRDLCAGALSWWNRTPFVGFPDCSRNVSSTTFQSPELLIQCGFI